MKFLPKIDKDPVEWLKMLEKISLFLGDQPTFQLLWNETKDRNKSYYFEINLRIGKKFSPHQTSSIKCSNSHNTKNKPAHEPPKNQQQKQLDVAKTTSRSS